MWQRTIGLLSAANMQLSLADLEVEVFQLLFDCSWSFDLSRDFLPSCLPSCMDLSTSIFFIDCYLAVLTCWALFLFVSIILFHSASYEYVYMIYKCIMYMSIYECVYMYICRSWPTDFERGFTSCPTEEYGDLQYDLGKLCQGICMAESFASLQRGLSTKELTWKTV